MGADDGICHSRAGGKVRELDLAEKGHPVLGQLLRVYDPGVLQDPLQKTYPADRLGLGRPGRAVAAVLAEVSLGTGFREIVLDLRI